MSEMEKYRKKPVFARLTEENLEYFFKFAQEHKTKNITETFNAIVEQARLIGDLEDVTFIGTDWEKNKEEEQELLSKYTSRKAQPKKQTLVVKEVKFEKELEPEPEPEVEDKPKEDDEDVFTL